MESLPLFDQPIAHRGLHNVAEGVIENSASAFEKAITHHYAIECDVQLSGDDKAVVFHDYKLERLCGQTGLVRQISAGQLQRIPLLHSNNAETPQSLQALLDQVKGRTLLVIELKQQADREGTLALAREIAHTLADYTGDIMVESFDPDVLHALRKAGYLGPIGIIVQRNTSSLGKPVGAFKNFLLRHMLHWPQTRFQFVSSDRNSLTLPLVRFWRARGMPVTTWTVRSTADATQALNHCDQIVFEGFLPSIV